MLLKLVCSKITHELITNDPEYKNNGFKEQRIFLSSLLIHSKYDCCFPHQAVRTIYEYIKLQTAIPIAQCNDSIWKAAPWR